MAIWYQETHLCLDGFRGVGEIFQNLSRSHLATLSILVSWTNTNKINKNVIYKHFSQQLCSTYLLQMMAAAHHSCSLSILNPLKNLSTESNLSPGLLNSIMWPQTTAKWHVPLQPTINYPWEWCHVVEQDHVQRPSSCHSCYLLSAG